MWSIGGHRHDEEARKRAQAEWRAMPVEGKVALVGLPVASFVGSKVISVLPQIQAAGFEDEVHAGGLIVAVGAVLAVRFTFGRAVEQRLEQEQERLPVASGRSRTGVGESVPALRDATAERWRAIGQIQRRDPAFSEAALASFARALVQRAHGTSMPEAAAVAPYATPLALGELHRRLGLGAELVGGQVVLRALAEAQHWVTAEFEQRMIARGSHGDRHVALRLTLRRSGAARSPTPVDLLTFACPACGAPVAVSHPDGACRACGTGIAHGQLSWQVVDVAGALDLPWWREDAAPIGGGAHPSLVVPVPATESIDGDHRALQGRNLDTPLRSVEAGAGRAAAAWFAGCAGAEVDDVLHEDLVAALRYERTRAELGSLTITAGEVAVDQVEWLRAGQDGWNDTADLRVVLTLPWCVRRADGWPIEGDPDGPTTRAVVVRLLRPAGGSRGRWRAWQVLEPREYLG